MPIEVKNLSAVYDDRTGHPVTALQNVSFRIGDGEIVGVMGRTGSGKSTLIQLIAGLLSPFEGSIVLDGNDIGDPHYDRRILRRTVGVVFQFPEIQLFETTVQRDVEFTLRHSGLSREEKEKRVRWALETVGFSFEEIRLRSPLSLSGGEKRRAAIAGVLAAKPRILIFDEPVAGLDPMARERFIALIDSLNAEGVTILLVSHNADFLCRCARRILVLEEGKLAADGGPREVFADEEQAKKWHIGPGEIRSAAGKLHRSGILGDPRITDFDSLKRELLTYRAQTAGKGGERT